MLEFDHKKPYATAMAMQKVLDQFKLTLDQFLKEVKDRSPEVNVEQARTRYQLRKLVPEIGEALDYDPTWITKAVALSFLNEDMQKVMFPASGRWTLHDFQIICQRARSGQVRDVARNAWESVMMDEWPRMAAVCDFGLSSTNHLGSLQYAVRSGVSMYELDHVLGSGPKITKLCQSFADNPYRDAVFTTPWDSMPPEEQ